MRKLIVTIAMTVVSMVSYSQNYKMVDEPYDVPFGEWYQVEGDSGSEGMYYMDNTDSATKEYLKDMLGESVYNKPTRSGFITDNIYYKEWDNVTVEGKKAHVSYVKNLADSTIGLEYVK